MIFGVSDAPKFDITWTEIGDVSDPFNPEILTYVPSKYESTSGLTLATLRTSISLVQSDQSQRLSVQIMSRFGALDTPTKK